MNEREKLIEIISDIEEEWSIEMAADYLTEQGVTVRPARSGDVLYDVYYNDDEAGFKVCENVITDVSDKKIWFDNDECYVDVTDIGNSVFLIREEAEAFADSLNHSIKS